MNRVRKEVLIRNVRDNAILRFEFFHRRITKIFSGGIVDAKIKPILLLEFRTSIFEQTFNPFGESHAFFFCMVAANKNLQSLCKANLPNSKRAVFKRRFNSFFWDIPSHDMIFIHEFCCIGRLRANPIKALKKHIFSLMDFLVKNG